MKPVSIASDLYWSLPGPRDFIARVEEAAAKSRLLWINLPNETLPGTWERVKVALEHGRIDSIIDLAIKGGTDIASDIGVHFGRRSVTAEELGGFDAQQKTAIMLRSEGESAIVNCERYARAFFKCIENNSGNVLLVIGGHEESMTKDVKGGGIQVVTFDGGLSRDEMDAYVALRMLNRSGPGSTRLTRSIISEFAGFDVELAEQLMQLDESHIVNIVDNLVLLMGDSPFRWRHDSWLMRTRTYSDSNATHVLNDRHLTEHGPVGMREEAKNRIKRRYWRACVSILTPWLEERRLEVISVFERQITKLASLNSGKIAKPIGKDRFVYLDPAELEFNNIVGMSYNSVLTATTPRELEALNVCKMAKTVRDDIAHLRMPDPNDVSKLIVEMDRLLSASRSP